MTIDPKAVLDHIDADELVKVTLDLANLDSPTGSEGPVADYVHDWLVREGFDARKVGLYPNRPNVMATLPGSGGGRSLCFNSHMDTTIHKDEWWTTRHAADPSSTPAGARGTCSSATAYATARARWRPGCSPPRPSRIPASS